MLAQQGGSRLGVPDRRYYRTPATAPGPSGPQMAAAFLPIRDDPLAFLDDAWRRYGDVVQFPIPSPPSYLVVAPRAVRQVLVGNARSYGKATLQYRALSLVTGEGLLTADTAAWRAQRRLVQPAFHHETVTAVARHTATAVGRLLDGWDARVGAQTPGGSAVPERAGPQVDVDAAMMHTALEVVGHALFGTDLSADADRLAQATLSALDVVIARARVPITPPSWLPTPANRRLAAALRTLDGAVGAMLAERAERAERAEPTDAARFADAPDMLDLLLAARDDEGRGLTARQVRDQVVTFVVAGHETVASALSWAWWLLATHPEAERRLHAEVDTVLAGRPPTIADLPRLPWARACLDETLRLYPPAWLLTRNALAPDVLADRDVPAGALVIISPWLVHRHPDAWSAPESFDPARFLPGGTVDRDAYLPFGAGPRQCIGRDFGLVEGTLILAAIASRYRLRADPGQPAPRPVPLVTVRPAGGLHLRLDRRPSHPG